LESKVVLTEITYIKEYIKEIKGDIKELRKTCHDRPMICHGRFLKGTTFWSVISSLLAVMGGIIAAIFKFHGG
jgi:hypothetical protein